MQVNAPLVTLDSSILILWRLHQRLIGGDLGNFSMKNAPEYQQQQYLAQTLQFIADFLLS